MADGISRRNGQLYYKAFMALVLTPVIYLVHGMIKRYFGEEVTLEMKLAAMNKEND